MISRDAASSTAFIESDTLNGFYIGPGMSAQSRTDEELQSDEFWSRKHQDLTFDEKFSVFRNIAHKRKSRTQQREDSPAPKIRATEEKMAARLRNFHISNDWDRSKGFIGVRRFETFEEIEDRLSNDSESEEVDNRSSEDAVIKVHDDIKQIVKSAFEERLLLPPMQPNPCTDLVLWMPKDDFTKRFLPKPDKENLLESLSSEVFSQGNTENSVNPMEEPVRTSDFTMDID